jgi:hypothetical protein
MKNHENGKKTHENGKKIHENPHDLGNLQIPSGNLT